jgi:hypothetical protein
MHAYSGPETFRQAPAACNVDADRALGRLGMFDDVVDGLRRDPVGGYFDGCRQGGQGIRSVDLQAHFRCRQLQALDRSYQPEVIQHGRAQVVDQLANLGRSAAQILPQLVDDAFGPVGILAHQVAHSAQLELHCRALECGRTRRDFHVTVPPC